MTEGRKVALSLGVTFRPSDLAVKSPVPKIGTEDS
jgi:hypothetical protein